MVFLARRGSQQPTRTARVGTRREVLLQTSQVSQPTAKGSDGMRLKLVLIASLVSAVVGAGASIAIILELFSSLRLSAPDLCCCVTFILPVVTVVVAVIFVYRHTARRRKTRHSDRHSRLLPEPGILHPRLALTFAGHHAPPQPS